MDDAVGSSSLSVESDKNTTNSIHEENAGGSTQDTKKVSQSGNFSKLEQFPRLILNY